MLAASRRLQELVDAHDGLVVAEVKAERAARLAEATAMISRIAEDRDAGIKRTVQEYDAIVTILCIEQRYEADMAKGLRASNKLAVDASMSQLSALQSLSSTTREEMRLARVGDGP